MNPLKKVAIVQSNYIPWKGYFDMIAAVDEFILYDNMQYTRRDWRNRNQIKTPQGVRWLTIPVEVKGRYSQKICETQVSNPGWGRKHWSTIVHNYTRAKCFKEYRELFESLYLGCDEKYLSRINYRFIRGICGLLNIQTRISWAMDYPEAEGKTERLIALCKAAGARQYLSGPSAKGYIDEPLFEAAGIRLSYMDYSGYPAYTQLHGKFEHRVTILDLIFNEGSAAPRFMKNFGGVETPHGPVNPNRGNLAGAIAARTAKSDG